MNFTTIRYFLMTAQEASFSRAAQKLHITQQTLSGQIGTLEKELGCRLFLRHVPLELTYGGRVFLQYARQFQEGYRSLEQAFQDIRQQEKGCLRLGIAYTRGHILLPGLLQKFQAKYPLMEVEVREESNANLLRQLQEGETDLVLAYFPEALAGIQTRTFQKEEIWLVVARKLLEQQYGTAAGWLLQELEQEKDPRVLEELPFLRTDESDLAGYLVMQYLNRIHFSPRQKVKAHNLELLLELCVAGAGACFSPDYLVRGFLNGAQRQKLVEIPLGPSMQYDISFGWRRGNYQWSMLEKFMTCALESSRASLEA